MAILQIAESSFQTKERLQVQIAYQALHVVEVHATKFSLEIKEMLQTQVTYQTPHVAKVWATKYIPSK